MHSDATIFFSHYPNDKLLPIPVCKLSQFIATTDLEGLKPASITSMVSALSYVHKMKNMPNPADTFITKKLLYALRRKQVQEKRCPITLALLSQFMLQLQNIVKSPAIELLIKCMFSFAFFALLRVGEMAITRTGSANTLQRQNVLFSYNKGKVQSATLTFTNFKHSNG